MPDLGEGIAEVELVAWHVKPGDTVAEDQVLADVMTDKATVEIPSPVAGRVLALGGEVGQMLAVGAELIRIELQGAAKLDALHPAAPAAPSRPRKRRRLPPPCTAAAASAARPAQRTAPRRSAAGSPASRSRPTRLACGTCARVGARHRPAGRAARGTAGPHHAGRSRCPCRPRRGTPGGAGRRAPARGVRARGATHDGEDRRPAPQDRAEDAGGQAPHPALHLRRGSRRQRDWRPCASGSMRSGARSAGASRRSPS